MALNVPMQQSIVDGPFPLPFPGEVFLLTRDEVQMSFRDERRHAKHLKGRLFVTNLRMVFLINENDRTKANAETFEMPFRGILDERFNQPIFGCNNLTTTVQYYDEQPFRGGLTMRIDFIRGGVNTFLPVFNNVLGATRAQMNAELRETNAQQIPAVAISQTTPSPTEYFPQSNMAFVDPSDPSRIYTTQPAGADTQRRSDAPTWSVSGEGLRRRG